MSAPLEVDPHPIPKPRPQSATTNRTNCRMPADSSEPGATGVTDGNHSGSGEVERRRSVSLFSCWRTASPRERGEVDVADLHLHRKRSHQTAAVGPSPAPDGTVGPDRASEGTADGHLLDPVEQGLDRAPELAGADRRALGAIRRPQQRSRPFSRTAQPRKIENGIDPARLTWRTPPMAGIGAGVLAQRSDRSSPIAQISILSLFRLRSGAWPYSGRKATACCHRRVAIQERTMLASEPMRRSVGSARRTQGILGGRSEQIVKRVLDAAILELARSGHAGFGIDAVASTAEANKDHDLPDAEAPSRTPAPGHRTARE
jgi:hypothetical protein